MLKTHNQEIEVLRAVAVLFVVIEHLPGLIFWESPFLNKVTSNFSFWSGVDLFFVISGFVISQSLIWQLTSTEDQNIITKIKSFWIRRIYRVIPSAWIWLFITLFLHTLFDTFKSPSNINNDNFKESLAILLEVDNVYQYFYRIKVGMVNSPLTHYWSLSLESQFYVFFPFLLFFKRKWVTFSIIIIFVQFFIERNAWNFAWAIRSDGFLCGAQSG